MCYGTLGCLMPNESQISSIIYLGGEGAIGQAVRAMVREWLN